MAQSKEWNWNEPDKEKWLNPSEDSIYLAKKWAEEGVEQDVYILGVEEPVQTFVGKVIVVYHRYNDNEDKWIVAPEGKEFTDKEILQQIDFQEKFFDGVLVRR